MQGPKKTNGKNLAAFQTIVEFIENLYDYFNENTSHVPKSLSMYYRLVTKNATMWHDDEMIERHIQSFKSFCVSNRESIRNQTTQLSSSRISFSDNIYIDIEYVFKHIDRDTTRVVWEYLLTISAYVDPENRTKEILQSYRENSIVPKTSSEPSPEGDFLSNMMKTISSQVGNSDSSDPMSVLSGLMSSDTITQMMDSMNSNIEDGKLDINKLVSSVSGMVEQLKTELDSTDDPMMKSLLNMIQLPKQ